MEATAQGCSGAGEGGGLEEAAILGAELGSFR